MTVFERKTRFGGEETGGRGLSKNLQDAGFLVRFTDRDNQNG